MLHEPTSYIHSIAFPAGMNALGLANELVPVLLWRDVDRSSGAAAGDYVLNGLTFVLRQQQL